MQCVNKLKQIGIAVHNYHDTNGSAFPVGAQTYNAQGAAKRLSGFAAMLPFIEQPALYQSLTSGKFYFTIGGTVGQGNLSTNATAGEGVDAASQAVAGSGGYMNKTLDIWLCPSDGGGKSKSSDDMSRNNYRLCFGDFPVHTANLLINLSTATTTYNMPTLGTAATNACNVNRGAFGVHTWNGMHSITDGTSNTLLASERCIATNSKQVRQGYYSSGSAIGSIASFKNLVPVTVASVTGVEIGLYTMLADAKGTGANLNSDTGKVNTIVEYSGKRWIDGALIYTGFVTLLPPNGPAPLSAAPSLGDTEGQAAVVTASAFHPGGVNAVLADGAVKFYSDTTDATTCYNTNTGATYSKAYSSGKSSHGVWGALGSRNGGESVSP
jgi:hypothetical protein